MRARVTGTAALHTAGLPKRAPPPTGAWRASPGHRWRTGAAAAGMPSPRLGLAMLLGSGLCFLLNLYTIVLSKALPLPTHPVHPPLCIGD